MKLWSVVRWVRAAGFSAACAALAAAGHFAGGGSVDRLALLAAFVMLMAPAVALSGRERTLGTILPAVAVSQVVLHLLLSQAAPAHSATHSMAAMAGMAAQDCPDASPGLGMLLMHAVAVLITSWWLEYGEAGLCGLVRSLASWALRPLTPIRSVPVRGPRRAAPVWRERRPFLTAVLRHVLVTRGPPAGAVALG